MGMGQFKLTIMLLGLMVNLLDHNSIREARAKHQSSNQGQEYLQGLDPNLTPGQMGKQEKVFQRDPNQILI